MTPITGPQDVGGQCPYPNYEVNGRCCCTPICCWDHCEEKSPPLGCLVPNAQWIHDINTNVGVPPFSAFTILRISGEVL